MALINVGSFDDLSLNPKPEVLKKHEFLSHIKSISAFAELDRNIPENIFEYATSMEARGIDLKTVKLTKGFEGFLGNIFNKTNEIYFLAWAWDLSGQPVYQYPSDNNELGNSIFNLKVGKVREFMGTGINLFPKRKVVGGIILRIQIWESDQELNELGKKIEEMADTIQKSELNNLLTVASLATGISGATITLIKKASFELAKLVGTILKENGDDYVDLFEGHFPADATWIAGKETNSGNSANIEINKY